MSLYIHKSHNVTVLLYHLVFPAQYRRAVFDAAVDQALRDVCLGIEARYQLKFLEIGTDRDHVHFLVTVVHGSAGGHSEPPPFWAHAMRTDSGRPSSSMRFRTATPTFNSVA